MDESLRPGGVDNPPPLINPFHLIASIINLITSRTVSNAVINNLDAFASLSQHAMSSCFHRFHSAQSVIHFFN
jgi:hypothetical protein